MEETKKLLIYKIIGLIILLIDTAFIVFYCVIYSDYKCPSDLADEIHTYSEAHHIIEYDDYLSTVFPCWTENDNFDKGIMIIYIIIFSIVYFISIIECFILFILFLSSKKKILFFVSIASYVIQIIISVVSMFFVFDIKKSFPDKIFNDFGELGPKIRDAYDIFHDTIFPMKISSIYFLISSIVCLVLNIILFMILRNDNNNLDQLLDGDDKFKPDILKDNQYAGEVTDFADSSMSQKYN